MRKYSFIIFLLLGAILVSQSCSYKRKNVLFKTKKEIKTKEAVLIVNPTDTSGQYRHRIKVGDRLLVRFLNNYDIGGAAGQSATAAANSDEISGNNNKGYLVNYDSSVILPLIGKVNLIGLTRLEASNKLEKEYSKFIVNPIIDINIASLGVTVLGEISSPGKIYVDKENTTLIDVLALAGGITNNGQKKNIKIIRGKEIILVNLRKIEALESPAIIMQDNDIVYVEPYPVKAATEPLVSITPLTTLILSSMQTILLITQFYIIYKR